MPVSEPNNQIQSRRQVLIGAIIDDIEETTDTCGRDWLILKLAGGMQVYVPDEGMVFVHPEPN